MRLRVRFPVPGMRKRIRRHRSVGEGGGILQAAPHGSGQFRGAHHLDVRPVGGQLLPEHLGVAVGDGQPVPPGVGLLILGRVRVPGRRRHGGPLAQPQELAAADVHDGGPDRKLRKAVQLGTHVEAGGRREGLPVQDGHGGGEARQPEEALGASAPVKAHEVPLAEAAAEAPGFNDALLFPPRAASQVEEADGVLGVHGGHEVLERLAGRLDARLHAGRKFDVGQAARRLKLA